MCPRRGDVEGQYLRPLIGRPDGNAVRAEHPKVEIVVRVRRLEPGAGELKIEMQRVRLRKLIVETVKQVLFVPLVVHHDELRWVKEAAAVESVDSDEVSPVLTAIGEVHIQIRGAEGAVAGGDASMRRSRT